LHRMATTKSHYKELGPKETASEAFRKCIGESKTQLMGEWSRSRHRVMGRIRFVAMATGFNAMGWEQWKTEDGGDNQAKKKKVPWSSTKTKKAGPLDKEERGNYFIDSMFVLHHKDFEGRVPQSSMGCPLVQQQQQQQQQQLDPSMPRRVPIVEMVKREGVYMMSAEVGGFCDLDQGACQLAHFPACHPGAGKEQLLCHMSRSGIEVRKGLMASKASGGNGAPPPIPTESLTTQQDGSKATSIPSTAADPQQAPAAVISSSSGRFLLWGVLLAVVVVACCCLCQPAPPAAATINSSGG